MLLAHTHKHILKAAACVVQQCDNATSSIGASVDLYRISLSTTDHRVECVNQDHVENRLFFVERSMPSLFVQWPRPDDAPHSSVKLYQQEMNLATPVEQSQSSLQVQQTPAVVRNKLVHGTVPRKQENPQDIEDEMLISWSDICRNHVHDNIQTCPCFRQLGWARHEGYCCVL